MLRIRDGRGIAGMMPEQRHLRYAVMTGTLGVKAIGNTVIDWGCDPSDAKDYCVSPKMVRALVKLGGDPSTFTYFLDEAKVPIYQIDSSNEEKFRRPRLLFKTFRQRILLGAVFPVAVVEWFDEFVDTALETDGCPEYLDFRALYKVAVGDKYSLYKMTLEFARYTKFLPVKVFFKRHFASVSARVCGVVEGPDTGMHIRVKSKSEQVQDLRRVMEKILYVEHQGITQMIMSFL